jgi:hypothetical protein
MSKHEISLLIITAGVILELLVMRSIWLAYASIRWDRIRGHVVESYVMTSDSTSESGQTHKPVIKYKYTYGGVDYTGDKIAYSFAYGAKSWADKLVNAYRQGKEINVYVQPNKPKRSVLLTGLRPLPTLMGLVIPPLVTFGALIATR